MQNFLFQVVAQVSAFFIQLNQSIALSLNSLIGRTAYALMTLIDKQKLGLYEQVAVTEGDQELALQQTELNLLNAASQVRDHAQATDDWTSQHTEAINAIAEALMLQFNWEEDHVNQYLKEVVESIDGLEFDLEE
jgi:hypothetical protein